jgi:1-acyl-sn-glycerol-3-phosphate acyltransferase
MSEEKAALRPQVYRDERPESYFAPFYAWARTHNADTVQDLIRLIVVPWCMVVHRARASATAHVPQAGAAIIAPNHFSALDHFFVGLFLRRRLRFMAKSQLFVGALGPILAHAGAFPVRRGHHDEEAIATALEILRRGGVVVLYPEGGRSRTARMAATARPGVGRLALESGAPVVPVAIRGSERARNWKRFQFPRVAVTYGTPRRYFVATGDRRTAGECHQAVADQVLAEIRALWEGPHPGAGAPRADRRPRRGSSQPVRRRPALGRPLERVGGEQSPRR